MDRKFRRVLIHFGADKTGSTAIQMALDASRNMLLEAGLVAYPPGQWHAQLGSVFCDCPERYIFNFQMGNIDPNYLKSLDRRYLDELNQWLVTAPACETLVFSYEGFVDLDVDALRRFKAFCDSLAEVVGILLYVRPPLSYAVSAMSQRVKQGRKSWPPNDPPISPYRTFLEKITQVFAKENVCVRLFSPEALKNGDVVADFMSVLGVPVDVEDKVSTYTSPTNKSLTGPGLCLGEMLISVFGERGIGYGEGEFHQRYGQYLSSIPGEKNRLAAEQIDEILVSSRLHAEYLEQEFCISFSEDAQKYLRSTTDVRPEQDEFMRSIAKALADMVTHNRQYRPTFSIPDLAVVSAILREGFNILHGQLMTFDVEFSLAREVKNLEMGIHILDSDRRWAFGTNSTLQGQSQQPLPSGTYRVSHHLLADLPAGKYTAGFAFAEKLPEGMRELAWHDVLCEFQVHYQASLPFAGYAYLPAQISLCHTRLAVPQLVVIPVKQ